MKGSVGRSTQRYPWVTDPKARVTCPGTRRSRSADREITSPHIAQTAGAEDEKKTKKTKKEEKEIISYRLRMSVGQRNRNESGAKKIKKSGRRRRKNHVMFDGENYATCSRILDHIPIESPPVLAAIALTLQPTRHHLLQNV